MTTRSSENAERRDLGCHWVKVLTIILILLIPTILIVSYGINAGSHDSIVQYGENGIRSFNSLFGNFSGMTLIENYTAPGGNQSSFVISYSLLGITEFNGRAAYKVNVSSTAQSSEEEDKESLLVWIDISNGQIIQTYDPEDGLLEGSMAEKENTTLALFTTEPLLCLMNSSVVQSVAAAQQEHPQQQEVTLGQVKMQIKGYEGIAGNADNYGNWITDVGVIPSSGIQFVVYCTFISPSGYQFAFRIISLESHD